MKNKKDLTHFSLFTGIGGLDLAAEWAGFKTVGQCEYADYPTAILEKHWPDVQRWRDIKDVTGDEAAKKCGREITVISGGFPCQPHSVAGKRLASDDNRELSGEFIRVIREVRPKWVVGENVPGLLSSDNGRIFGRILRDLAGMGYDARWCVYSAFQAGMEHERKRLFIIANANRFGRKSMGHRFNQCVKNAEEVIQQGQPVCSAPNIFQYAYETLSGSDGMLYRNDDGIPAALDRLKCLGNAVVPQQAYPLFAAIYSIENSIR